MARTRKDPRHRAREAALQILYQWEIGGRAVEKSAETFFTRQWPDADEPPDALRAFATQLAVDTVDRLGGIDPLIDQEELGPALVTVCLWTLLGVAGCAIASWRLRPASLADADRRHHIHVRRPKTQLRHRKLLA